MYVYINIYVYMHSLWNVWNVKNTCIRTFIYIYIYMCMYVKYIKYLIPMTWELEDPFNGSKQKSLSMN